MPPSPRPVTGPDVKSLLAAFRLGFPDCEAAILVDVREGVPLASDTALHIGQERLDRFAELGRVIASGPPLVVKASALGCCLALRSLRDPKDALVAVFAPGADLSGVTAAAAKVFTALDEETAHD